jgi:hypothetical protein
MAGTTGVCISETYCITTIIEGWGWKGPPITKLLNKHQLEKCFEVTNLLQMVKKSEMGTH